MILISAINRDMLPKVHKNKRIVHRCWRWWHEHDGICLATTIKDGTKRIAMSANESPLLIIFIIHL